MKIPKHYLAIKPILDLTLFNIKVTDDYFKNNKKLIFSNLFAGYHKQFLANSIDDKHELLLMILFEHCAETSLSERKEIVDVIMENDIISKTIIFMSGLQDMSELEEEGNFDADQNTSKFILGLRKFIDDKVVNPQIGMFFVLFFNNFADINLGVNIGYELDKKEYTDLISRYLKLQTDFKLA